MSNFDSCIFWLAQLFLWIGIISSIKIFRFHAKEEGLKKTLFVLFNPYVLIYWGWINASRLPIKPNIILWSVFMPLGLFLVLFIMWF